MQSSQLAAAYRLVLRAAESLAKGGRDSEFEAAGWVLAHLVLYDRTLIQAASGVLGGADVLVDGSTAMCPDRIGNMTARHPFPRLIELAGRTAAQFLALLERIPESRADALVAVRLRGRTGRLAFDDRVSWRDIVQVRAEDQLPRLADYIDALLARPTDTDPTC